MKLQRSTLILLSFALGLGVFVYFSETRRAAQLAQTQSKGQQIFTFAVAQVQSLKVQTQQQTLQLERNNKPDPPRWLMTAPSRTPASDASVSYLMDLLVKGKSDRILQVSPNELQDYGLDRPQAHVGITLKNQQTHQLILGKPDFNRNFLYAQADPPTKPSGKLNVLLVSTDFENAVNRPLSEWKIQNDTPSSHNKTPGASTTKDSTKASPSSQLGKGGKTPAASTSKDSTKPSPSPKPTQDTKPSNGSKTPDASTKPSPSPKPTQDTKGVPKNKDTRKP